MHDGVVDAATAELKSLHETALHGDGVAEEIEGQRMGTLGNETEGFLHVAHFEDGQDGTENLLLHDCIVCRDTIQEGGRETQGGCFIFTAHYHLAFVNETQQAVEMLVIDNLAIVLVLERTLPVHLPDFFLQQRHELCMHVTVTEDVVGSDARLTHIEPLAEGEAAGGQAQVTVTVDDDGRLATQFQGDRREMA